MEVSENNTERFSSDSELLRRLVDKTSSMVAYWDTSLRCRFANRAYLRWFGVTPEWLLGKHIRELLGPLYPLNVPYIERALCGEEQAFEREIPDPAGGCSRHSLASYIPDVSGGRVRGFFALVTDISEIKRAQLAFKEAEERFRLTLDEAPIGMAIVALDGRFVRVNRVLCEIVGYTAEELTGLTFQAITHPEDLDTDLGLAGQLGRGEIPRYQLEKRYLRKDGGVVNVMLSGSVLRKPDGSPQHFIAQVEDITERKRHELAQEVLADVGSVLATSLDYEQTLKTIAELAVRDLADLCIVELLEGGEVRRLRVTSHDPGDAWLCEFFMRVPLDRRRPHLMQSVLNNLQTVFLDDPSEETIESLAQSPEHLEALRATRIRSMVAVPLVAKGHMLGAIALILSGGTRRYGPSDVRLAEQLAERAAMAIESARLYQQAQRATQARDDVLGVVAHDLRNPLNNIVLQMRVLQRQGPLPDPRCQKAAASIARSAGQLDRLIQDLLDVSRLEAGHLVVEPERLPTRRVILEAVESQKAVAAAASLELELEIADPLPAIWADRLRVVQILENLLGNAIKFSKPGQRITVGARAQDEGVLFWVRDTGKGIAPEHVPRLFERFWQATKSRGDGAGLGLSIVQGLVKTHGGRIWAESRLGVGSTFYFTLPGAREG